MKPDEKFYGGKVEFDDMFKWTVLPEGDGKYGIAKQGYAPAYPVIEGVQRAFHDEEVCSLVGSHRMYDVF